MVVLFVLVASFLRNGVKDSYEEASNITNSLGASLKVAMLEEGNVKSVPLSDKEAVQNKGYKMKITNSSDMDKNFSIALINNLSDMENTISFSDIRYQVIKDNKVVVTSNLSENGYLYNETLKSFGVSTYEIKFWIDKDVKTSLSDKKFSSKIVII